MVFNPPPHSGTWFPRESWVTFQPGFQGIDQPIGLDFPINSKHIHGHVKRGVMVDPGLEVMLNQERIDFKVVILKFSELAEATKGAEPGSPQNILHKQFAGMIDAERKVIIISEKDFKKAHELLNLKFEIRVARYLKPAAGQVSATGQGNTADQSLNTAGPDDPTGGHKRPPRDDSGRG